ncbi:hypothetical protein LBWT_X3500 (plasmid) [Leptolyngbya boryana IAM M-101]|nr:hypothetical protein LBWT_X3500 [Leptolyngbya boryana IAM M-101]BAS66626.1 hypothetical protein LBDG_X3500 [Leptolyngbya boryana dg5]
MKSVEIAVGNECDRMKLSTARRLTNGEESRPFDWNIL